MKKGRILSGMRSTGKLHLGNLIGALENWVALQDDYECFFEVADWHALTTGYDQPEHREYIQQIVVDWLSVGIDPHKSTIFIQSDVLEHAELALLLGMITPVPWLERNPTYKEWLEDPEIAERAGYGLLGYPVLQAADILIYRADTVPVGKDQLPHLELSREIARRFNHLFGAVFPEPEALLSEVPLLPGTDGRKMSKTYGNVIYLSDPKEEVTERVRSMFTDPEKIYKGDPGRPDLCPVYMYHQVYNEPETPRIRRDCSSGALGCVECKAELAGRLNAALEGYRHRRAEVLEKPGRVDEVLADGAQRARAVARETMALVREAMQLWPGTEAAAARPS